MGSELVCLIILCSVPDETRFKLASDNAYQRWVIVNEASLVDHLTE